MTSYLIVRVPSLYQNQCWFAINKEQWQCHHLRPISWEIPRSSPIEIRSFKSLRGKLVINKYVHFRCLSYAGGTMPFAPAYASQIVVACCALHNVCRDPANTLRNNDVVITSKRRHFDVITSKWRCFDVITTSLLRHVFGGERNIPWREDVDPEQAPETPVPPPNDAGGAQRRQQLIQNRF